MKTFDQLWEELSQKVAVGDPTSGTVAEVNSGVHAIGKKILEEAGEVWLAAEHESDAALAEDQHLLDEDELDVINRKLKALKDLIESAKDAQVLRRSVESLSKATDDFAARRMNESIKKALSGKKIEEI